MLVQRLRRWLNIEPTMGECLVFAGKPGKVGPRLGRYSIQQSVLVRDEMRIALRLSAARAAPDAGPTSIRPVLFFHTGLPGKH